MNIFHFFAIDFCEWARPDGGAANGQNRPKYGGFPPACGACGAGRRGRASPARRPGPMEKVCRYGRVLAAGRARGGGGAKSVSAQGGTARAGFPRTQARTGGKSMPVRQGFGRRRAGARGRASPARRPGPMEKVCRYGRVLAAAGRGGRQPRGRERKIGQRARDGGGHGAAAASLRRRGNRRGTGRRRAGRRRKIGQRAKRSGRTAGKSRAQDGGQGVVGRRRARL